MHGAAMAQVLDQDNVCVRAGHHCAKPLMRVLGLDLGKKRIGVAVSDEDASIAFPSGALESRGKKKDLKAVLELIEEGVDFVFSTRRTRDAFDIGNTMTHEIGHLLGLDHTPVSSATMNAASASSTWRASGTGSRTCSPLRATRRSRSGTWTRRGPGSAACGEVTVESRPAGGSGSARPRAPRAQYR